MKRSDLFLAAGLLLLGGFLWFIFTWIEASQNTGETYAKVTYHDETIMMIDLQSLSYTVYDTIYQDQIDTGRAGEGIFYVPGAVTTDMSALYEVDSYAMEHEIIGIKLLVKDGKIAVVYQESPKDVCQLQDPTNSPLFPLVCLPNELVITIYTNWTSDEFIPDVIME
ncbi:MAG: NusG domain II-containing protein [Candidatus Izemoplasmatales bacterium]|nr:NusG domain II-containing protein [Candidatus Izemoplasmatales bacterium]